MRYWDKLATYTREGFEVIVDKSWEDLSPRDCFDDSVTDIDEIFRKIDNYDLDWFMLRVRVMIDGHELGSSIVGGFLYEDAKEVLTDGTAEDLIDEAIHEAKGSLPDLIKKLQAVTI
jgi:hypothetical protein